MSSNHLRLNLEQLAAAVACVAAMAFFYGYSYLYIYYARFGVAWYVEQLSVSSMAIFGARDIVILVIFSATLYFLSKMHLFIDKLLLILFGVGIASAVALDTLVNKGLESNLSLTLKLSSVCIWWMFGVCTIGVVVFAKRVVAGIDTGSIFIGFGTLVLILLYLPQMTARINADSIISGGESYLPLVVSGDNKDWYLVGISSGQAVLVKFKEPASNRGFRLKIAQINDLELKTKTMPRFVSAIDFESKPLLNSAH
ncbi:hypothetical protein ACA097_09700 [Pseudomonas sp. QL9]|uniref:hypothetical protein n=1 Tax=Pseudomonas sp. QL9 TaxID=3242725 RepID=UPI00352BB928